MTTNEAIYKVLTTSMKKWCREEYKAVKDEGYTIDKEGRSEDGYFIVRNPRTERYVYITYTPYARTYTIHTNNCKDTSWEERQHSLKKTEDTIKCVDFVAMLGKPTNREYRSAMNLRAFLNRSETKSKYEQLVRAKENIKWQNGYVINAKKELEEAQKKLEFAIKKTTEAEHIYKELRKEFGLA